MTRCLILSCSAVKRPAAGLLPAIERYDGPRYRILRHYLRTDPGDVPDVWIVSAEFGLIPGDTPIPDYDRILDPARAHQLAPQMRAAMAGIYARHDRAFVVAGSEYAAALVRARNAVAPTAGMAVAPGGVGAKNGHLKRWLEAGR